MLQYDGSTNKSMFSFKPKKSRDANNDKIKYNEGIKIS